jgi:hypothetical protein
VVCYGFSLAVAFSQPELCLFLYFLGFFGDLLVRFVDSKIDMINFLVTKHRLFRWMNLDRFVFVRAGW